MGLRAIANCSAPDRLVVQKALRETEIPLPGADFSQHPELQDGLRILRKRKGVTDLHCFVRHTSDLTSDNVMQEFVEDLMAEKPTRPEQVAGKLQTKRLEQDVSMISAFHWKPEDAIRVCSGVCVSSS